MLTALLLSWLIFIPNDTRTINFQLSHSNCRNNQNLHFSDVVKWSQLKIHFQLSPRHNQLNLSTWINSYFAEIKNFFHSTLTSGGTGRPADLGKKRKQFSRLVDCRILPLGAISIKFKKKRLIYSSILVLLLDFIITSTDCSQSLTLKTRQWYFCVSVCVCFYFLKI